MPKEPDSDTIPADTQPAAPRRNPWPPLPPPSDVEHVTLSGGLFGGFDVMRDEYIDRSKPRRGLGGTWGLQELRALLRRLLHRS